jgi:hypothetical protein
VDPWFVRVGEYPGVGVQVAAREPLTLAARDGLTRGLRVLLADGVLPQRRVLAWASGTDGADDYADDEDTDGDPQAAPGA